MMSNDRYEQIESSQRQHFAVMQHEQDMGNSIAEWEMRYIRALPVVLSKDGNQHCFLYGENLQEGVAGFGDSVYLAMLDFNKEWHKEQALKVNDDG